MIDLFKVAGLFFVHCFFLFLGILSPVVGFIFFMWLLSQLGGLK